MADTKISALPASTTPLTGNETLPVVQGGVTKKVSVADLTAGRDVTSTLFSTSTGTVTPASGVATTVFTAPSLNNGVYIVSANMLGQAPPTYQAVALVLVGGTTLNITTLAAATTLTITVSGQNIQVTQNSGDTNAVTWTVTRVS